MRCRSFSSSYLYLLLQSRHADDLRGLLQLHLGSSTLCFHLQRCGRLCGHVSLCLRGQLALWGGRRRGAGRGQWGRPRLDGGDGLLGGLGWTLDWGRVGLARNCGGLREPTEGQRWGVRVTLQLKICTIHKTLKDPLLSVIICVYLLLLQTHFIVKLTTIIV